MSQVSSSGLFSVFSDRGLATYLAGSHYVARLSSSEVRTKIDG